MTGSISPASSSPNIERRPRSSSFGKSTPTYSSDLAKLKGACSTSIVHSYSDAIAIASTFDVLGSNSPLSRRLALTTESDWIEFITKSGAAAGVNETLSINLEKLLRHCFDISLHLLTMTAAAPRNSILDKLFRRSPAAEHDVQDEPVLEAQTPADGRDHADDGECITVQDYMTPVATVSMSMEDYESRCHQRRRQDVANARDMSPEDLDRLHATDPFSYYSIPSLRQSSMKLLDEEDCKRTMEGPSANKRRRSTVSRKTSLSVEAYPDLVMEDLLEDLLDGLLLIDE